MVEKYPFLQDLIHSYFHQDFDIEFDDFDDALQGYARTHSEADRNGLRTDILRFLAENPENTLEHFNKEIHPDLEMAENDNELKDWLARAMKIACVIE